ncbi:MAG: fibronectin/fibrinogen-binding protein [Acaryochloridaceae cyanobacterium CSU_3_4]|nr:fibronectin/fibrinogen-binding protein [Acaryochloridaceae cyanobacterium CSU_3_4]
MAACRELRSHWLPARIEQVVQRDRFTICIVLRTLQERGWLTLSWHPQAARLCMGSPPPKGTDTFTFSQQLRHQLNGLALIGIEPIADWERVIDLQIGQRPQAGVDWHLYIEVMGKYSNVILTNAEDRIVTAAHQVSSQQSRVRPIQTGDIYQPPPSLKDPIPTLSESFEHWQQRVALIPGSLKQNLLKTYRGLSSTLVLSMLSAAALSFEQMTEQLREQDWQRLFQFWQDWLLALEKQTFTPGLWQTNTSRGKTLGYSVLGWEITHPFPDTQTLLDDYYTGQLGKQTFQQLQQQLQQKVKVHLQKLQAKAETFQAQLSAAETAETYREQADLLMAHLHTWQTGMTTLTLTDFESGEPRTLSLNPEKNAVQNAQAWYKRHQKLKRSRAQVQPLLQAVQDEIAYLEQVEASIHQLQAYQEPTDLLTLHDIRDELIAQNYFPKLEYGKANSTAIPFYQYQSPSGWVLLIGRNNHQNDQLTFRTATAYDLWFHTQEIPGSHVLLRLEAGAVPEPEDLQFAANMASYYSRARQSHQVPVIYTESKHVYKPKGAKPGMVVYKHEQVIWGQPQQVQIPVSGS